MLNVTESSPAAKQELEKLEITLKQLEVAEKQRNLECLLEEKSQSDQDRLNLEKLQTLNILLMTTTVDMDRTVIGSEQTVRPVYLPHEEEVIRKKVLEIVKRL